MKVQKYKHDLAYSYALGATLTFELIKHKPNIVNKVFISSSLEKTDGIKNILNLCKEKSINVIENDKAFNILSPKGNCYVIGEFKKEDTKISDGNHIVLVNPSDAGNLGTIIRTAVGFNINNIAIIKPAVDFYDPRVVRASMGALFHLNIEYFSSIEDYIKRFPKNNRYSFMLDGSKTLHEIKIKNPYSIIFGNEATGLPYEYSKTCESVRIVHSKNIDSLSLPMAVGIVLYEFDKNFNN